MTTYQSKGGIVKLTIQTTMRGEVMKELYIEWINEKCSTCNEPHQTEDELGVKSCYACAYHFANPSLAQPKDPTQ